LTVLCCPQPANLDVEPASPASPTQPPSPANPPTTTSLPLAVVDALLCILVDAPRAIRSFEELKGLEVIVKCLKKAGLPKDVRCANLPPPSTEQAYSPGSQDEVSRVPLLVSFARGHPATTKPLWRISPGHTGEEYRSSSPCDYFLAWTID